MNTLRFRPNKGFNLYRQPFLLYCKIADPASHSRINPPDTQETGFDTPQKFLKNINFILDKNKAKLNIIKYDLHFVDIVTDERKNGMNKNLKKANHGEMNL